MGLVTRKGGRFGGGGRKGISSRWGEPGEPGGMMTRGAGALWPWTEDALWLLSAV